MGLLFSTSGMQAAIAQQQSAAVKAPVQSQSEKQQESTTGGSQPFQVPAVTTSPASSPSAKPQGVVSGGLSAPQASTSWWYNPPILLTTLLSGAFGLGGTALALCFSWLNTKRTVGVARATSDATINQKANEAELAAIQVKLDTFYGPYLQRSGENELLAGELRARQPAGYRMLLSLVNPDWFSGLSKADATIVSEVVANGLNLREMIRDRAGAVEPAVLPYLERAGSHFTMLHLAKEGALDGDPERFRRFVYPRQLDAVLKIDMERLRARAAKLRAAPFAKHEAAPRLEIPADLVLEPWSLPNAQDLLDATKQAPLVPSSKTTP